MIDFNKLAKKFHEGYIAQIMEDQNQAKRATLESVIQAIEQGLLKPKESFSTLKEAKYWAEKHPENVPHIILSNKGCTIIFIY